MLVEGNLLSAIFYTESMKLEKYVLSKFDPNRLGDVALFREFLKENDTPECHLLFAEFLYATGEKLHMKEYAEHVIIAYNGGERDAIPYLANMYFFGEGIEKDIGLALVLFEKCGDVGIPDGYFSVGNEYLMGVNVPYDHRKAFHYLKKASDGGSAKGMNGLGLMYLCGFYVDKDVRKAKKLFAKARIRGSSSGYSNMMLIDECGSEFDYKGMMLEHGLIEGYIEGKDALDE